MRPPSFRFEGWASVRVRPPSLRVEGCFVAQTLSPSVAVRVHRPCFMDGHRSECVPLHCESEGCSMNWQPVRCIPPRVVLSPSVAVRVVALTLSPFVVAPTLSPSVAVRLRRPCFMDGHWPDCYYQDSVAETLLSGRSRLCRGDSIIRSPLILT
jgi:hypothetical protein